MWKPAINPTIPTHPQVFVLSPLACEHGQFSGFCFTAALSGSVKQSWKPYVPYRLLSWHASFFVFPILVDWNRSKSKIVRTCGIDCYRFPILVNWLVSNSIDFYRLSKLSTCYVLLFVRPLQPLSFNIVIIVSPFQSLSFNIAFVSPLQPLSLKIVL